MPEKDLGGEPNHEDYDDENDQERGHDVTHLFSLHHLEKVYFLKSIMITDKSRYQKIQVSFLILELIYELTVWLKR